MCDKEELTIEGEIESMRFDHGYISPCFTTNAKGQWIDFKKTSIFLSETKIPRLQYIPPSLAQACCELIIITENIDIEALSACILNKLRTHKKNSDTRAQNTSH